MADPAPAFTLSPPAGLLGATHSALGDLAPGDVALCGYFCDNLGGGPPGARFLTRQIRYVSEGDPPPPSVRDLGDLNVFPLEPRKHEAAIAEQLGMIGAAGATPILVGGDGSGAALLASHSVQLAKGAAPLRPVSLLAPESAPPGPFIAAVDFASLAPAQTRLQALLDAIAALPDGAVAGALYGAAPALDWRGADETRIAHALLRALALRLSWRRTDAAA